MATSSSPPPPSPPPSLHDDQNADNYQAQPSLTNPNSPKSTPPLLSTTMGSPPKKIAPLPWTQQETINLIQAYQEKWYSLKRGQLKANQWEEIAITVAARCGYDEPSKSATQCRHKMEKLRKRYRSEKLKSFPNMWQYFDLMDRMERGPLPISARPMVMIDYKNNFSNSINDDDSDDEEAGLNYRNDSRKNKSKSINHIVHNEANMNRSKFGVGGGSDRVLRVLQKNPFVRKRKEYSESDCDDDDDDEEEEEEEEEQEEGATGSEMAGELATEIRAFAERFVKMETKKIEMMRETQKFRMEMENKRTQMIQESQRKIADMIHQAFASHKKMKMA